jgi:hypothetical protein
MGFSLIKATKEATWFLISVRRKSLVHDTNIFLNCQMFLILILFEKFISQGKGVLVKNNLSERYPMALING